MNKSSVEAVDEAQKKQKEAEKKMEQAETKARNEKKRAELEIRKAKKEVKARTEKMRDTEYFWGMGYITVILFVIIQNGAFPVSYTHLWFSSQRLSEKPSKFNLSGDASAGYDWRASSGSGQGSQGTGRSDSETVGRKRTTAG